MGELVCRRHCNKVEHRKPTCISFPWTESTASSSSIASHTTSDIRQFTSSKSRFLEMNETSNRRLNSAVNSRSVITHATHATRRLTIHTWRCSTAFDAVARLLSADFTSLPAEVCSCTSINLRLLNIKVHRVSKNCANLFFALCLSNMNRFQ